MWTTIFETLLMQMETNVIHTLSAGAGETISICFYNKKLTYNIIYTQIHTYIYICNTLEIWA